MIRKETDKWFLRKRTRSLKNRQWFETREE
jgi:hypothetical protein